MKIGRNTYKYAEIFVRIVIIILAVYLADFCAEVHFDFYGARSADSMYSLIKALFYLYGLHHGYKAVMIIVNMLLDGQKESYEREVLEEEKAKSKEDTVK